MLTILPSVPFTPKQGNAFISSLKSMPRKVRLKERKREKGEISFSRTRDLTWTFRAPAADGSRRGMVRIASMNTESTIRMAGKDEKTAD